MRHYEPARSVGSGDPVTDRYAIPPCALRHVMARADRCQLAAPGVAPEGRPSRTRAFSARFHAVRATAVRIVRDSPGGMPVCIVVHSRPVASVPRAASRGRGVFHMAPQPSLRDRPDGLDATASSDLSPVTATAMHVDLGAIAHNVRRLRDLVGPDATFVAALKGNAYGFGLLPVAETVLGAGA